MEMDNFEWLDIPTYNGKYQVNELGDIRSLRYKKTNKPIILKPRLIRGYLKVDLYRDTVRFTMGNHQAVAMAFHGHNLSNPKITVNHKDHNILNNHKDNLEIITLRKNSSLKRDKGDRLVGTYKKKNGSFVAKIYNNSKRFTLGHFSTEKEASEAYLKALNDINNGREINEYKPQRTSQVKGVHYNARDKMWICSFYSSNGKVYLGKYKSEQLAINALDKAKEEFISLGKVISKPYKKVNTKVGVTFCKSHNKWGVRINGLFVGNYKTEKEAIEVSDNCDKALLDGISIKEFKNSLKKPKPIKIKKVNSSSVKGITYKSTKNIWEAYHYGQGKKTYIGSFKTEQDAINSLNILK